MPKKSRRVAVRQAQLSGRAKRERSHGPAGVPAIRPSAQSTGPGDDGDTAGRQHYERAPVQEPQGQESPRFTPASAARARGRTPQLPPIETYFAPELRRIGVGMGVVAIILVVLKFVLQ
ncbi:MAG: hypothetical protein EXR53_02855 [Dehalococcoidia bacterium]|nr:hypothetical protein [Dehalococcoidia bacterium]